LKKIDLGQTITILANIGVIAGIVFLGYELRQNNLYLKEEARYNVFQNRLSSNLLTAVDPDIARLWNWKEKDEPLSELDERRRADLIHTLFLRWQHDYQSVELGTLAMEDLAAEGMQGTWRRIPGFYDVWVVRKAAYSHGFVEWMEENVVNER